jgi:hypothetical protein
MPCPLAAVQAEPGSATNFVDKQHIVDGERSVPAEIRHRRVLTPPPGPGNNYIHIIEHGTNTADPTLPDEPLSAASDSTSEV